MPAIEHAHKLQFNRDFPSNQILTYMAIQVGLGAVLNILDIENSQWLNDLFTPLESVFSTFRTAFVHSSTPIASKLFLTIWWLVILPWGLIFSHQWTKGFKPHPNGLKMSYTSLLGLLVAALFLSCMLGSLLSVHDYSYYWMIDKSNSPSRGDLVPALMSSGPFALSIWVAVSSFLIVPCISVIPLLLRTLLKKLPPKENKC